MKPNPIRDFGVDRSTVRFLGRDLQRPECILAEPDGTLWAADARGGVVRIRPDGDTARSSRSSDPRTFRSAGSEAAALPRRHAAERPRVRPERRFPDLELRHRLPGGHVARRRRRRCWPTASTASRSARSTSCCAIRATASGSRCRRGSRTGCTPCAPISPTATLRATRTARSASSPTASDFTNEIRFDANEEFLYVVETTGGCITRLRIDDRGNVAEREIFGPTKLGNGAWPDGIAFDSYGNLWGTLVLLGQAVRADAAGRHARPAGRRRSGEGRRARAGVPR